MKPISTLLIVAFLLLPPAPAAAQSAESPAPTISGGRVFILRQKTGLPVMDCKRALVECHGDAKAALRWLQEHGAQLQKERADCQTPFGRFGVFASFDPPVGAMVELRCETSPVTQNGEVVQLANDLARQLSLGPGAKTAEELLDQPSPRKAGVTLREQKEDMFNRFREVFKIGRLIRIDGPCAGYSHNSSTVAGVLVEVAGGNPQLARDVCMHIAAMRPEVVSREELDPAEIEKERAKLREAAVAEGRAEKFVDRIVEGRLRKHSFAERVLLEQPFVKGGRATVGEIAADQMMTIKRFVRWEIERK